MWWCLTGPVTFLPIHAAGIYGENEKPGSKLSDYAVSSYTPTLTNLISGNGPRTVPRRQQLLAVALPFESRLPSTLDELDRIQRCAQNFPVRRLVESEATVENVVKGMEESNMVHFACHGVQDPSNPTESALLLSGGSRLEVGRFSSKELVLNWNGWNGTGSSSS